MNDLTTTQEACIVTVSVQGDNLVGKIGDWDSESKAEFKKWLRSHLLMGEMYIEFEKKDGTLRKMRCTLKDVPEYERKIESEAPRKKNEGVMSVFDLDKSDWRSFRIDSIKTVRFDISK